MLYLVLGVGVGNISDNNNSAAVSCDYLLFNFLCSVSNKCLVIAGCNICICAGCALVSICSNKLYVLVTGNICEPVLRLVLNIKCADLICAFGINNLLAFDVCCNIVAFGCCYSCVSLCENELSLCACCKSGKCVVTLEYEGLHGVVTVALPNVQRTCACDSAVCDCNGLSAVVLNHYAVCNICECNLINVNIPTVCNVYAVANAFNCCLLNIYISNCGRNIE